MSLTVMLTSALFVIYLSVQLLFCFKAKKPAVKLAPVYLTAIPVVLLVLMFFGAFGQWSAGGIENVPEFAAGLLLIILGLGFIGDIIAWAIWFVCAKLKNKGAKASLGK